MINKSNKTCNDRHTKSWAGLPNLRFVCPFTWRYKAEMKLIVASLIIVIICNCAIADPIDSYF